LDPSTTHSNRFEANHHLSIGGSQYKHNSRLARQCLRLRQPEFVLRIIACSKVSTVSLAFGGIVVHNCANFLIANRYIGTKIGLCKYRSVPKVTAPFSFLKCIFYREKLNKQS